MTCLQHLADAVKACKSGTGCVETTGKTSCRHNSATKYSCCDEDIDVWQDLCWQCSSMPEQTRTILMQAMSGTQQFNNASSARQKLECLLDETQQAPGGLAVVTCIGQHSIANQLVAQKPRCLYDMLKPRL